MILYKTLALLLMLSVSTDSFAEFDQDLLRQLGLTSEMLNNLDTGVITEGKKELIVNINRQKAGIFELNFKENNDFYINSKILNDLKIVDRSTGKEVESFKNLYPSAKIFYEKGELNIFISESERVKRNIKQPEHTGFGAFFNYEIDYDQKITTESDEFNNTLFGLFTGGFNYNGYLYRTSMSYFNEKKSSFEINYNYVQKDLIDREVYVKVGDVYSENPLHGSVDILGIQIGKQTFGIDLSTANFDGIVSIESKIEVYLNGQKIYETTVPAGNYEISDLQIPSYVRAVEVIEKGIDGTVNRRDVIVQGFGATTIKEKGFGLAMGMTNISTTDWNGTDTEDSDSLLLSGFYDVYSSGDAKLKVDGLITKDYYFGGAGYSLNEIENPFLDSFSSSIKLSNSRDESKLGSSINLSFFNMYYNKTELINLNIDWNSEDYTTLNNGSSGLEYLTSLNVSVPVYYFDSLNLGAGYTTYHKSAFEDDIPNILDYNFALNKRYENGVSIGLNGNYDSEKNWNISARLSIPFDFEKASDLSFTSNHNKIGLSYTGRVSGLVSDLKYSASTTRNSDNSQSYYLNANKKLEDVDVSLDMYAANKESDASLTLKGGMAYSDGYFDAVPEQIGDTFGFVKIDDIDGVVFNVEGSEIKTEDGVALIPNLMAHNYNEIHIDPLTLPSKVKAQQGISIVYPSRGSVIGVNIETSTYFSDLVLVVGTDDEPLPLGADVRLESGEYVTLVGLDGLVLFETEKVEDRYQVSWTQDGDENKCIFDITNPYKKKDQKVKTFMCK